MDWEERRVYVFFTVCLILLSNKEKKAIQLGLSRKQNFW